MCGQICGHPMAQSRWHIKLTTTLVFLRECRLNSWYHPYFTHGQLCTLLWSFPLTYKHILMFTRSWKNPAVIPHFPHAVVLFLCFCKSLESIVLINFIYALTPIFVFTSHNQSFLWHYTLMITINLQSNFLVLHPFITSAFNVVDLCWYDLCYFGFIVTKYCLKALHNVFQVVRPIKHYRLYSRWLYLTGVNFIVHFLNPFCYVVNKNKCIYLNTPSWF